VSTTIRNCALEVDNARGVIYVHGPRGMTLLRIQGLPPIPPEPRAQLGGRKTLALMDVRYETGRTSWDPIEPGRRPVGGALVEDEWTDLPGAPSEGEV
jgi:hypothetical protein